MTIKFIREGWNPEVGKFTVGMEETYESQIEENRVNAGDAKYVNTSGSEPTKTSGSSSKKKGGKGNG